jgi:hypothetical protein
VLNPPAPVPKPRLALGGRALEDAVRPSARSPYFNVLSPGGTIETVPYHRIAHERYSLYCQLG